MGARETRISISSSNIDIINLSENGVYAKSYGLSSCSPFKWPWSLPRFETTLSAAPLIQLRACNPRRKKLPRMDSCTGEESCLAQPNEKTHLKWLCQHSSQQAFFGFLGFLKLLISLSRPSAFWISRVMQRATGTRNRNKHYSTNCGSACLARQLQWNPWFVSPVHLFSRVCLYVERKALATLLHSLGLDCISLTRVQFVLAHLYFEQSCHCFCVTASAKIAEPGMAAKWLWLVWKSLHLHCFWSYFPLNLHFM